MEASRHNRAGVKAGQVQAESRMDPKDETRSFLWKPVKAGFKEACCPVEELRPARVSWQHQLAHHQHAEPLVCAGWLGSVRVSALCDYRRFQAVNVVPDFEARMLVHFFDLMRLESGSLPGLPAIDRHVCSHRVTDLIGYWPLKLVGLSLDTKGGDADPQTKNCISVLRPDVAAEPMHVIAKWTQSGASMPW